MSAQTSPSEIVWDQTAPDLATAQAYIYRLYLDGAATGTIVPVTCIAPPAGSSGIGATCLTPIPALVPGHHTVTISAANDAGEGPQSVPYTFTMIAVPSAPANLRLR